MEPSSPKKLNTLQVFSHKTANFARDSSVAEQKFDGGLKCHNSTST